MRKTKSTQRRMVKQTHRRKKKCKNKGKGMEKRSSPCCWITELPKTHYYRISRGERERERKERVGGG